MHDDLVYALRVLNIFLGAAAALWLIVRSWLRRRDYPHTVTLFLQVLALYVLLATYGSVEGITLSSDVFLTPFLKTLVHLAMLLVLALTQKRREFAVRVRG
jgi:hypothetical protein